MIELDKTGHLYWLQHLVWSGLAQLCTSPSLSLLLCLLSTALDSGAVLCCHKATQTDRLFTHTKHSVSLMHCGRLILLFLTTLILLQSWEQKVFRTPLKFYSTAITATEFCCVCISKGLAALEANKRNYFVVYCLMFNKTKIKLNSCSS